MIPALASALLAGNVQAQRAPAPRSPSARIVPAPAAPAPQAAVNAAPAQVVAAAVSAVDKMSQEVVRGNFNVAIERMNPLWQERMARQVAGGMEAVKKQLEGASKLMVQKGVSIISSGPSGDAMSFEVKPGKEKMMVNGKEEDVTVFKQWLVLVPTLTKYRIMLEKDPRPVFIEKTGFQVAVSDKDKDDWTFIDGSKLTLNELRGLYFTLPQDVILPQIVERQAPDHR